MQRALQALQQTWQSLSTEDVLGHLGAGGVPIATAGLANEAHELAQRLGRDQQTFPRVRRGALLQRSDNEGLCITSVWATRRGDEVASVMKLKSRAGLQEALDPP